MESIYINSKSKARYDAFVCWEDNEFDTRVALRLPVEINKYKPPKRLYREEVLEKYDNIVLDSIEEIKSGKFSQCTKEKLIESKFLIVICSPRAKESKRINEIILYFKNIGKSDKILPLIIEGKPNTSFPNPLFDEKITTIINENNEIEEVNEIAEPLATDITASNINESLRLLKSEKLRLIARLIGYGYDDLVQRHRKRERRRLTIILSMIISISISSISIFSYLWFNAIKQREIAEIQTQMATNLLNNLYYEIPSKFETNLMAQPIVERMILESIESLKSVNSSNLSKFNLQELLEIKSTDTLDIILWKARILRQFGYRNKALEIYQNIKRKSLNEDIDLDYILASEKFTILSEDINYDRGVYVNNIDKDLVAYEEGIRQGDIIVKANTTLIKDMESIEYCDTVLDYNSTNGKFIDIVEMVIIRINLDGTYREFTVTIKEHNFYYMLGIEGFAI